MRTVLPLKQQPDFRIKLPQSIALRPDVSVVRTDAGVLLARGNKRREIAVPDEALGSFLGQLDADGEGLPTANLSETWRQLFERLAGAGFLRDIDKPPSGFDTGLDVIARVHQRIEVAFAETFANIPLADQFVNGELTRPQVANWVVENYKYTKSAPEHISPLFEHAMSKGEHAMWGSFLKDESWHWKIYRPFLGELGTSYREVDSEQRDEKTQRYVETLRRTAQLGTIEYAAVMTFVEEPPHALEVEDDPLFHSLTAHYQFADKSVGPLWWHATENLRAGHSALGPIIISQYELVPHHRVDKALASVTLAVEALADWQVSILAKEWQFESAL